jgi:hypothetical protein
MHVFDSIAYIRTIAYEILYALLIACDVLTSIETPLLTAIQKKIFPEEMPYTVIVLEGSEMILPGA